ncbi:MmcQ/YjbR family DNA-binding protein [Stomatobaculum longum]|uniref:MmcQ/YjbR family DNA-binding protein n=1 Tax=Stomatobaculum longum TaxID=796942 RepID=UPI0028EB71FA|nr:MmcQ/YjbR family DNA-binding protein [Stomatobaculum longum]
MTRQELFALAAKRYGTAPDYPWQDDNAVLRRKDNEKWYAVVLKLAASKLGLTETGEIELLNVKCDPVLLASLRTQAGYFPAYHMNKEKWLSVRLGKPELDASVADLLALSYELTGPKPRSGKGMKKADGQRSKK